MAKITLNEVLDSIDPEINKILSTDYREQLDKRVTILDLSYNALKVNVYRNTQAHIEAYDRAYRTLVEVLAENVPQKRNYRSLADLPSGYFDEPRAPFIYVDGGDNNRFMVARSFDSIRNFVTTYISKDPRLAKTGFGQTKLGGSVRSKVDIGHIATEGSEQLVSPLELKISNILELGSKTQNPIIVAEATKALSDLYAIQAEYSYSFKNTAPEAISLAKSKLGELYVVVTLHRQKLNKAFSEKESKIFNRLKTNIALQLSKVSVTGISGSNSIFEDIAEALFNILSGRKKQLAKHKEHKAVRKHTNKPVVQTTNTKVSINKPATRDTSLANLSSLMSIINDQLARTIQKNMGTGERTDILNYRTGRLANSAKVERMTQSRAGMISAFYTYMRNPYGTFSEGGAQGSPRSRDPKLLISKSIREIAATQVSNRMRAVLS